MHTQPNNHALDANCLICGGSLHPSHLKDLWRCKACGFLTTDVQSQLPVLESLYEKGYFEGEIYVDYRLEEPGLRKNFQKRVQDLLRFLPDHATCSLLEVGCAYGFFLDEASKQFGRVAGIDQSRHAVARARARFDQPFEQGDFLQLDGKGIHDVVCMWDTIEHLPHPERFVAQSHALLKPGGLLAITTGDIESLSARISGNRWRLIHPPYHLHYFSKRTLTDLLHRHGFEVIHAGYPAIYRTLAMMILYNRQAYHPLIQLFAPLLRTCIPLNLYDILFILARKRP
ncbi:MAG: class I SAM-dependent methyltransferase [Magnetococcales bacterium]|nr:class I SAM-dependent methyltransferase [Magnetococcales bacterium]